MLNGISWTAYCYFILILTNGYYLAVLLVLYRQPVLQMIRKGFNMQKSSQPGMIDTVEDSIPVEDVRLSGSVHDLLQDLKNLFQQHYVKEEFMVALRKILQHYPSIRNTPLQDAITQQIMRQAADEGPASISIDEIRSSW